jgi:hypothetical protein
MQPFDRIGGPRRAPLACLQAGEGEQPISSFFQRVSGSLCKRVNGFHC